MKLLQGEASPSLLGGAIPYDYIAIDRQSELRPELNSNQTRLSLKRTEESRRYTAEDPTWTEFEMERGVCNISSPYTPQFVREQVLKSPMDFIRVVCRGVTMISELGYFFSCLKFDELLGVPTEAEDNVRSRANQLKELLTRLGPSFIKAGQVLANRPDILREDFMNELCTLQDDVPPFSDEQVFVCLFKWTKRRTGHEHSTRGIEEATRSGIQLQI